MSGELERASVEELTRAAFASGNDGDFGAMVDHFGPRCQMDLSRVGLGTYTGPAAIRRFFEDWIGSFDDWRIELEEVSDLGRGVVLVVATQVALSGRLPITRRVFELRHAVVYEWLDGLAIRVTNYVDLAEARQAALGLARGGLAAGEAA